MKRKCPADNCEGILIKLLESEMRIIYYCEYCKGQRIWDKVNHRFKTRKELGYE